jgi:AraC family transcriptional regulator, dual regulator of chb operon
MHYLDLMARAPLRFVDAAGGRPYHAALVVIRPRNPVSEPHTHADFYELLYVVAGQGQQRLDGMRQDLQPGDLVLVRPSDRHSFLAAPTASLQFINVAFAAAAWAGFLSLTGIDARRWDAERLPPRVRLAGADAVTADAAFRRALAGYDGDPTALDLVRLWVASVPWFDGQEAAVDSYEPQWLRGARAAMRSEDNLRDGLPRLLELAAVSHGYLARSMQRHHRMTPVEFVTSVRLRHAAALLTSTPASVSEVAQRCGFSTQSYFTRCFRRTHGVSPREFRERERRIVVP